METMRIDYYLVYFNKSKGGEHVNAQLQASYTKNLKKIH
jgi:hypothetical protein